MADNPTSCDNLLKMPNRPHAQFVTFDQPIRLERGGELPCVTVCYETWGKLNAKRDNAVWICHALTGDAHVAKHDEQDIPGWWDLVVGPGKAIDTDKYFVICPNVLGGCSGTTGPNSLNPATNRPYAAEFPVITVEDMVRVQKLLMDHLDIDKCRAVVGGSLGGQQALAWATMYPEAMHGCAAIATSPYLTSQAMAFDIVGRNAILRDAHYHDGQYYDKDRGPDVGLAIARMLAHVTYLSRDAMKAKFDADKHRPRDIPTEFEKKFSVGSYLAHQGSKFVERFDANSYLTLTMAMDLFELGSTTQDLARKFTPGDLSWLVLSFTSDWLFLPEQSQQLVDALIYADKSVSYCNIESPSGHDAFLLPDSLDVYGSFIQGFLDNLTIDPTATPVTDASEAEVEASQDEAIASPTSIFHGRLDYTLMLDLIPAHARVLDLGCESGSLLAQLESHGHAGCMGVELDEQNLVACVRRGLDVVQWDLERGLGPFLPDQFDMVVLSQTLQSIATTEQIMDDILRVGKQCIVSFPNFAYHKLRRMLADEGRTPETGGLLHYRWYNSPNVRFLSIADFETFCEEKGVTIHRGLYLDTESDTQVDTDPNLNADLAIFVVSR